MNTHFASERADGEGRRQRFCAHHVFAGRSVTSEAGDGGSGGSSLSTNVLHIMHQAHGV